MHKRHFKIAVPILIGVAGLPGCSSPDKDAATAAAQAEVAFQQGRYPAARKDISEALAARDDVSDYWLLLGRIAIATNDIPGAFDAYQNVIQLDRGNVEALRLLCQLGLSVNQPDKVDHYADQLLLLNPDDPIPVTMKGGAALQRGDEAGALRFAARVLAVNPRDIGALILKARVLAAQGQHSESAQILEESLAAGGDQASRLIFLQELYNRTGDRAGYERTLKRLAGARPKDAAVQLNLADMLYQTGHPDEARKTLWRMMRLRPADLGMAASIVDVWLKEGPQALRADQIVAFSNGASLEMKAACAQFANEIGRPDIAMTVLGNDRPDAEPNAQNSDAKAAFALAVGLQGRRADALGRLDQILAVDPSQPRALLARARLLGTTASNRNAAVSDARRVVADDPRNVTARLMLAELLLGGQDQELGESILREGIRITPDEPRIAARLAGLLMDRGQKDDAVQVVRDLTLATPASLRALRLRASIDPTAPDPSAPPPLAR